MLTTCKKDKYCETCGIYDYCDIRRPENLKPVDWKNYNSVGVVYCNYQYMECVGNMGT